jgi:hypothetical protein
VTLLDEFVDVIMPVGGSGFGMGVGVELPDPGLPPPLSPQENKLNATPKNTIINKPSAFFILYFSLTSVSLSQTKGYCNKIFTILI